MKKRPKKLIQPERHDPYQLDAKLPEPTGCPECGAVYRNGRWQWLPMPFEAERRSCPACRRAADGYPGGELTLSGPFVDAHKDELLALARHTAERQSAEHPQKRIIAVSEREKEVVVTTTDPKLARAIGHALRRAYDGSLDYRYVAGENFLRVRWER